MEQTYDHVQDNLAPEKKYEYWQTAFGLQKVDNLEPSEYMQKLAEDHVEGHKTYREVNAEITHYYQGGKTKSQAESEADQVSSVIYQILADEAFSFDILTLKSYHKRLFQNLNTKVFHPGEFRTVNLTKKEPILGGETVQYQDYGLIEDSLKYDFDEEKAQNYLEKSDDEKVARFTEFISRIWQVHPFYEGNTRTTVVFFEKYLRSLGYDVDNELFEKHARAFRDALVLANYSNIPKGIKADSSRLQNMVAKLLKMQ